MDNTGPYTRDFNIHFAPLADPGAVVIAGRARFTVLTSRLLRLEYNPDGSFEDRPSQAFWHRRQSIPEFSVRHNEVSLEIETDHLLLHYRDDGTGFTPESLTTLMKVDGTVWHFGDPEPGNLGGTFRTLDTADGALDLEPGLVSRNGWTVVDDSESLLDKIKHAGAIFCGAFAGETLGDYVAGPSHVLPTFGTARFASPLGVYDFQKRSSIIRMTQKGASELARIAVPLANSEGLEAHARAAQARTTG